MYLMEEEVEASPGSGLTDSAMSIRSPTRLVSSPGTRPAVHPWHSALTANSSWPPNGSATISMFLPFSRTEPLPPRWSKPARCPAFSPCCSRRTEPRWQSRQDLPVEQTHPRSLLSRFRVTERSPLSPPRFPQWEPRRAGASSRRTASSFTPRMPEPLPSPGFRSGAAAP